MASPGRRLGSSDRSLNGLTFLREKSEPETMDFPMKSMGFSSIFSQQNQSIDSRIFSTCAMDDIFTYKFWVIFVGKMLVNIPAPWFASGQWIQCDFAE